MVPVIKLVLAVLLIGNGFAMQSSKDIEGYPEGFLANCPGSEKPAIILRKSLRHLGLTILGDQGRTKSHKYNYYQAKQMKKDPNLDFKKKTVLFVGGYMDSPNLFVSQTMGRMYKKLGYNVLLMEANRFLTMHYPISSRYMRPVGKHLAEMLTNLTETGIIDFNTFELAGVSLGGHTISFIAKNYYRLTGKKIPRIIGIDPSGPCFRNQGPDQRLDESDGELVITIHTNIDGLGMAAPMGHISFYVNGGEYQPGDVYWLPCEILCSHVRSYTIWFSALQNPNSFIGVKCDSVQQARANGCYERVPRETNTLGPLTNGSNPGIYYLATTYNYPYFMGKDGTVKDKELWYKYLLDFNADDVMKM